METLFIKVTGEISTFCIFAEISNTCIGMFQKLVFLEISESLLLTAVAGLQSRVYNTTKSELLTKFVKGALKPNGVPF